MQSCKNILESLVVKEIDLQISHLPPYRREQISLSEVAAYALNRLPAMYATSESGWMIQHKKAVSDMRSQIESTVRRALANVKVDRLRDTNPLPQQEVANHARSLAALQSILGAENASWKDIPNSLESSLMTVKLKIAVNNTYAVMSKHDTKEKDQGLPHRPLEISWKSRTPKTALSWAKDKQKTKELETYMVDAKYQFSNVLEKLVLSLAYYQVQKLSPNLSDTIDLGEVVAYVLNRLPPMYATTEKGFKALRLRAREVYGKQVVETLNQAIAVCISSPNAGRVPLPLARFEAEVEEAVAKMNWILQRDDINWRNAPFIVSECLTQAINGDFLWRKCSEYDHFNN